MLIIDAHLDIAWNALDWNRDLSLPVEQIRAHERAAGLDGKGRACNTVSFPAMRRGRFAVSLMTVLARRAFPGNPWPGYNQAEACAAAGKGQLAYYQALEAAGVLRFLTSKAQLDAHLEQWNAFARSAAPNTMPPATLPLGTVLAMEGADPILTPSHLGEWFDHGLRVLGLVHYGLGHYAHGTQTSGPLSPDGIKLLAEMERFGVALDVTHLCDESFWHALDNFGGHVIASHHNCRALVPGERQLDDEQIKALIARNAVIGAALDAWMLYPGWIKNETSPEVVDLGAVCDQIDHVCQLAGDARHAAIGSDLDGGFGKEQTPHDVDTIADLARVAELLAARGYAEADIERIMWRNWAELLGRVLG